MRTSSRDFLLIIFTWIGVFISGTLTSNFYFNHHLVCSYFACTNETMLHETLIGLPISLYGLLSYFALAVLLWTRMIFPTEKIQQVNKIGFFLSTISVLVSFFLVSKFISGKKPLCLWCLGSSFDFLVLFILYFSTLKKKTVSKLSGFISEFAFYGGMILSLGGVAIQITSSPQMIDQEVMTIEKAPSLKQLVPHSKFLHSLKKEQTTVIEFGNPYCMNCRKSYQSLKALEQNSDGQLNLAFYFFEPIHGYFRDYAILSKLAEHYHKYWEFLDLAFNLDPQELRTQEKLIQLSLAVGIPYEKTLNALTSPSNKILNELRSEHEIMKNLKIQKAPTFYIYAPDQPVRMTTSATIKYILSHSSYSNLIPSNANQKR